MKRISFFVLCLALVSLACLDTSSAVIDVPQPTLVATRFKVVAGTTAAAAAAAPTLTNVPQLCARVIADSSLHLRIDADFESAVVGYLMRGEVVKVLDGSDSKWWLVKRDDHHGFVRSSYLTIEKCESEVQP